MAAERTNVLKQNPRKWNYLISGDGSWIYRCTSDYLQRLPEGSARPSLPQAMRESKELILSFVFSLTRFLMVMPLPDRGSFNSCFMNYHIISEANCENTKTCPQRRLDGLDVDRGNASARLSSQTEDEQDRLRLNGIPHPPEIAHISLVNSGSSVSSRPG
jgi:hypothetical protein